MKFTRFFLLIIATKILIACGEKVTTQGAFTSDNSLRYELNIETKKEKEIQVTYTDGKDSFTTEPSRGVQHQQLLYPLKPNTNYTYSITEGNNSNSVLDSGSFTTTAMPDSLLKIEGSLTDRFSFDGYILFRRFFEKGADYLMNDQAEIVWYQDHKQPVLRPFEYTQENTILALQDSFLVVEYDLLGKEKYRVDMKAKGLEYPLHHELRKDNEGNIIALSYTEQTFDLSKAGGNKNQIVKTDKLLKFNTDGEILWEWSPFDVANPIDDPEILNYLQDWGHANAIAFAPDGNYLISFRDFWQIWKIDANTGDVLWKLGKDGEMKIDALSQPIKQHSIHFDSNGYLTIFDNGDKEIRPNSRILVFELDEENMEAKSIHRIELPLGLSSYRMCSAYKIDENHYLVCTSRKGLNLSVVDLKGKSQWTARLDNSSYRAYYLPSLRTE